MLLNAAIIGLTLLPKGAQETRHKLPHHCVVGALALLCAYEDDLGVCSFLTDIKDGSAVMHFTSDWSQSSNGLRSFSLLWWYFNPQET
jgi:hypothetical protein